MTTATANRAPTEAEIREAARRHLDRVLQSTELIDSPWVFDLAEPLRYTPPDEDGWPRNHSLWDDLRPTQAARLNELIEDIWSKTDVLMVEAANRVVELVVEAGLTFAAEYPDAPRRGRADQ